MREVDVNIFKTLRTVNLTSKTKNVVEGRKCTKKRDWKHYWININDHFFTQAGPTSEFA